MGKPIDSSQGPVLTREWTWNHYTVSEFQKNGVVIRALSTPDTVGQLQNIPAVFVAIEEGNQWIADPAMQVKQCQLTATTTNEMRTYQGAPLLVIDYKNVVASQAFHEMGHAVFDYLQKRKPDVALAVADAFVRMRNTKNVSTPGTDAMGAPVTLTLPSGLALADPVYWGNSTKREHPQEVTDEYFASLRENFVLNRSNLASAIEKLRAGDPSLPALMKRVFEMLERARAGQAPASLFGKTDAAQDALNAVGRTPDYQKEIDNDVRMGAGILKLVAQPSQFDGAKAKPAPAPKPSAAPAPDRHGSRSLMGRMVDAFASALDSPASKSASGSAHPALRSPPGPNATQFRSPLQQTLLRNMQERNAAQQREQTRRTQTLGQQQLEQARLRQANLQQMLRRQADQLQRQAAQRLADEQRRTAQQRQNQAQQADQARRNAEDQRRAMQQRQDQQNRQLMQTHARPAPALANSFSRPFVSPKLWQNPKPATMNLGLQIHTVPRQIVHAPVRVPVPFSRPPPIRSQYLS